MTALAELQTVSDVLDPADIPDPVSWPRVVVWAAVGAVLTCWGWLVLSLFVQQWRGA